MDKPIALTPGGYFHIHRIPVTSEAYFARLIVYIHRNPQRHRFVSDFRTWPYSAFAALTSTKSTRV